MLGQSSLHVNISKMRSSIYSDRLKTQCHHAFIRKKKRATKGMGNKKEDIITSIQVTKSLPKGY